MNGLSGPRRLASPVRLSLNPVLGGDIDGAWWPHTSSLASELPDLVDVLHTPLGEILDIRLNWSAMDSAPILDGHFTAAERDVQWNDVPQRIMVVVGRGACARLMVIPHLTTQSFAQMVLRQAATVSDFDDDDSSVSAHAKACFLVRAARARSAAGL